MNTTLKIAIAASMHDIGNLCGSAMRRLIPLIIGAVFFIPFLFSFSTIDPALLPRFLAWSVLVFVLVCIISSRQDTLDFSVTHRLVFPVFLCYLLISAISLTNAVDLTEGVFEWLKIFLSLSFFYLATVIIGGTKDAVPILTKSMTVTGMALAFMGLCQYYEAGLTAIPGNYGIHATMTHKNLFASALFLISPFVLYGTLRFSGLWRIVSLISLALILSGMIISRTRTVWGTLIFSALLVLFCATWVHRKNTHPAPARARALSSARKPGRGGGTGRGMGTRILSFLLVLLICLLLPRTAIHKFVPSAPAGLPNPAATRADQGEYELKKWHTTLSNIQYPISNIQFSILNSQFSTDSLDERVLLWKKTLRMIRENPVLGVGPGQWKIVLPRYGRLERWRDTDEGPGEVWFQRPHNDYLWVLAETGVPGLLCYLLFFLTLIVYTLRIVFRCEDREKIIFFLFMLFGITGYMVISFFSFPKERIVHTIFLMLMGACVVGEGLRDRGEGGQGRGAGQRDRGKEQGDRGKGQGQARGMPVFLGMTARHVHLAIMVGAFFCMVFGYARLDAEIHVKKAISAREAGQWEEVISEIDQAGSRFYTMDPFSTPIFWYRGLAEFSLGNTGKALEDFKKAYVIHPYHIHVLNNLGTCHALNGDHENAVICYQKALAIFPEFHEARRNLNRITSRRETGHPTLHLGEHTGCFVNNFSACQDRMTLSILTPA